MAATLLSINIARLTLSLEVPCCQWTLSSGSQKVCSHGSIFTNNMAFRSQPLQSYLEVMLASLLMHFSML